MKRLYERILEWDWEIVLYSLTSIFSFFALVFFFAITWRVANVITDYLFP